MTTTEIAPEQKTESPAPVPTPPAAEPDPYWDVEIGSYLEDDQYLDMTDPRPRCRLSSNGADDFEGEGVADDGWTCSRSRHPDHWRHVALSGQRVLCKWGGSLEGDPEAAVVDPDPEPGPDFQLEVGELYKFRNRPTALQVVGFRRDGRVEVLDLTHLRYRVLKREQLVPRKDELVLTAEQVRWVGKFMAERRAQARQNALTQRRNGYFRSLEDLNGVLNELKLEPHELVRTGRVSFEINITARGQNSDRELRTKLADWLNAIELPDWLERQGVIQYHNVYVDMRDA